MKRKTLFKPDVIEKLQALHGATTGRENGEEKVHLGRLHPTFIPASLMYTSKYDIYLKCTWREGTCYHGDTAAAWIEALD